MIDETDKQILTELQKDADRRMYQLEKIIRVPRSTIHNRIQKLKKDKVITQIKVVVDPEKLNLNVCALIHIVVSFKKGVHTIAQRLANLRNVEEVFITAGVFDIIAKTRFKSNKELSDFIFNDRTGLKVWEGVERTESMICLETIKENGVLESV
ncbi:Lrp/AsnC family transcriptional regulator [Candidatus Woesearchaeota archaeon]|nr:Lrp/AsnC family transcriptional regulator [Candidatus Woesearchaeota archaeon]